MKKIFFLTIACAFALASCTRDESSVAGSEDNADVTIVAGLSTEAGTRALNPGSQNSGFDNVDETLYDVRYQLEVLYEGTVVREAQNIEAITGKPGTTVFTVNLARGKEYRFVIWADFVLKGGDADLHYDTSNGLSAIAMKTGADFKENDESKDAYFVSQLHTVSTLSAGSSLNLTLKRPLAKIRFIAADYNEAELGTVTAVQTNYYSGTNVYTEFNAVTGEVGTALLSPVTTKKDCTPVVVSATEMAMFWDYIFVPAADAATGLHVEFTISYKPDAAATTISQNYRQAEIVVKPNMLTTVKANLFTSPQTINVTIDDRFDDYIYPISSSVYIGETGYPTIAAAMVAAQSGETITILEGTFAEDVTVKPDVTVEGAGVASVITGYITLNANSQLKNLRSYYLGQTITGGVSTRTAVIIQGADVTIDGVTFDTGATNAERNFTTADNRNECIVTTGAATNLTFTNNTINDPYWKGMYLNSSIGYVITGNTFNYLNPFSLDAFSPMTVTDNNFVRTSGAFNSQLIHLISTDVLVNDATQLTGDIAAQVAQIKESNTWVGGSTILVNFVKPVRVQNLAIAGVDFIAGKAGTDPAGWSTQNP